MTYSRMMEGLKFAGIEMDRKVLSDIAIKDPAAFEAFAAQAKAAIERKSSQAKATA
ncbi:MAG: 50S ribosomal protein L20 [Prosthecobacter sp.]|nr:50S ribosomal protein L20 [Prosthecobacter sp.]